PMDAEAAVFTRDHGKRKVARHGLERHPAMLERRALELLRDHNRGDRRVEEAEGDDRQKETCHDEQDHEAYALKPGMSTFCRSLSAHRCLNRRCRRPCTLRLP